VVGIVENPADLSDDFALVAPGTLTAPEMYVGLVDTATDRARGGGPGRGPGNGPAGTPLALYVQGGDGPVAATVLVGVTLAMGLVGLVAAAGFVVVAQRRQRQLGVLAAVGGTDRHVRLVTVANGLILGVAAAVAGGTLGVVGWLLAAPAVESAAGHRIPRGDLPWGLIVAHSPSPWPCRRWPPGGRPVPRPGSR
jgi:putative ABC transport system permease protein